VRGATWLLAAVVFGSALSGSGVAEAGGDDGDAPDAVPAAVSSGRLVAGAMTRNQSAGQERAIAWDRRAADPIHGKRWSETATIRHGRRWSNFAGSSRDGRSSDTAAGRPGKRWDEAG